jgi:hypothetical protein
MSSLIVFSSFALRVHQALSALLMNLWRLGRLGGGDKNPEQIAEGLALLKTVIFLDSEGMQCPQSFSS